MINLKKQSTLRSTTTQPRVARILRDNITIPHYWVVGGVVITNLKEAQEYKSSR